MAGRRSDATFTFGNKEAHQFHFFPHSLSLLFLTMCIYLCVYIYFKSDYYNVAIVPFLIPFHCDQSNVVPRNGNQFFFLRHDRSEKVGITGIE